MAGVGEPVTCIGKPQPPSGPFLSAPYAGWAEIASYFDHDQPDYAIDGKIVVANGLTITGTPSPGSFPSYYSPKVRQYINYDGHNGYDYDIVYQPVLAAATGVVTFAGWESSDPYYGYGQMIVIRHAHGYMTLYGHLSRVMVRVGEHVSAGQQIAISGNTGHSTGPHLHFSVYHNCHVLDPYGWTGHGPDPVKAFNGETSSYLWKKGEAPEVLNFIPGWPTFGSGLLPRPAPPVVTRQDRIAHLLLLKVPTTKSSSASVSLVNVQQHLSDEQRQLGTLLEVLKSQGLINSFTLMPDAGAVRVVGSISAQQLEGLPGVASIAGDRVSDVNHAQSSLAQALLSQMTPRQVVPLFSPSLLDDQWSWQISLSVEEGGPYVLGFTHPGSRISVAVHRAGHVVSWGRAVGMRSSGAFVVALKGNRGAYATQPGDVVTGVSDGKSTSVDVVPLSVGAGGSSDGLTGYAPAGSDFQVTAVEDITGRVVHAQVQAPETSRHGRARYRVHLAGRLLSGDALIASLAEASGNTLFSWSRVSGLQLGEESAVIHGWEAPGSTFRVGVFNGRMWRASGWGRAMADGYLTVTLRGHRGHLYPLKPGTWLMIRHGRSRENLTVPMLTGAAVPGSRVFSGRSRGQAELVARIWNDSTGSWRTLSARASKHGSYAIRLPHPVGAGTSVDVYYVDSQNLVEGAWATRGVVTHAGTPYVSGHAAPGETLVLHAFDASRRMIAAGVTTTDPTSGAFTVALTGRHERVVHLHGGDTVVISDGKSMTAYRVPGLGASISSHLLSLHGWTSARGRATVAILVGSDQIGELTSPISRDGYFRVALDGLLSIAPDTRAEVLVGSSYRGATACDITITNAASPGGESGRQITAL
ncbi:MAG TPA: M23 family metallopeptidase [Chloroflexota bacterium]|nr:M23 family metallopeptidase [Chloroflexota bacterium]